MRLFTRLFVCVSCLFAIVVAAQAAPLATYDSGTDWNLDSNDTTPAYDGTPWGAAMGWNNATPDFDGPYASLNWNNRATGGWRYRIDPSHDYGYGSISGTNIHPGYDNGGWAGMDVMHSFGATTAGRYLVIGNVRHDNVAGSGDGVELGIYRGQSSGDDQLLVGPVVANSDDGADKRHGVGAVTYLSSLGVADSGTGADEIYFRITNRSAAGNDGSAHHHVVYQMPDDYTPAMGTTWNSQADFVDYAADQFGQVGDAGPDGNPVWFYQAGIPGDQSSYRLLSEYDTEQGLWSAMPNPGFPAPENYGWVNHSDSATHPGGTSDLESIRSWLSLFEGTVDISFTASDANSGGGDGVGFEVYLNDTQLGSTILKDNGFTEFTELISDIEVQPGDWIHFAVLQRGSAGSDGTNFVGEIVVTGLAAVPEPGTFALWSLSGLVGLAFFRRRLRRRT